MRHFQAYELVDRVTFDRMGEGALSLFHPEALRALDDLRDFFGAPVTVNNWQTGGPFEWRGFRTPEKAAELGAPHSRHAVGDAFDCDIDGWTAEMARQQILAYKGDPLLSRIQRLEGGVSWVHFDLMPVADRIHIFTA